MDFNNPLEIISFSNLLIKVGSDISTKIALQEVLNNQGFDKVKQYKKKEKK